MSVPIWKKGLSYLSDITIEETQSPFNPYLRVSLSRGRFMLSTQGAIYSFSDLYTNFQFAFRALDFSRLSGHEVLLLGLGLGSIPDMLEKRFRKSYRYTAVEIDETVSWLAHHYVLQDLRSPIEIITTDALTFVQQSGRTFDLICMDIFQDDRIPSAFETHIFLENARQRLSAGGLLMYNRLSMTAEDKKKTRSFFEEVFLKVFPEGGFYDARTNWVLTNRPDWFRGAQKR